MDRKEQDILNTIDEKTKDIKVPDSLHPDNIHSLIENEKINKRKKGNPAKIIKLLGFAAVFAVVIIGAAVATGGNKNDLQMKSKQVMDEKLPEKKNLKTAESYNQLYSFIKKSRQQERAQMTGEAKGTAKTDMMTESAVQSADNASVGSHSETNVRQEGIDEADVVKTDGKYLYVLKDNRTEIAVVEPAGGEMIKRGVINCDEALIEEFYLKAEQQKLVLICSISGTNGDVMPLTDAEARVETYGGEQTTKAITFDISNPDQPEKAGETAQSGSYSSSRMSGDYLYLFTTYFVGGNISKSHKTSYVPSVNGDVIAKENIYLPAGNEANMYVVVTSVDINDPSKTADSKAIVSKGGELYVSDKNIYLYELTRWQQETAPTSICKVAYQDGQLEAVARGEIAGYINDSFSIDEYKDNLRVVATVGEKNAVYILDKQLNLIGSIKNLAKDERVYSARLMGDIGYFVTYRETDPLFSVDLSNPTAPKILGALKIPGFSDYLHPYGENQLLGIGMDVDEKTMVTSGVKLSMFDTTDKTDVKETNTYVLENVYSTDVSYSYKAATIDSDRNIIGFTGYVEGGQRYFLFSYDKDSGFQKLMEEDIVGNTLISPRGLFIENVLYVVEGSTIQSYSLESYKKIDDIIL